MALFKDRREAGRVLAEKLQDLARRSDLLVLGLPRGGVPVAFEVAKALEAPLDVFVVRKLGVPEQEELAMGAIASGGARVMNEEIVQYLDLKDEILDEVVRKERAKLREREQLYRGDRPDIDLKGRTIILVDDGLATGASMRAAVSALQERGVNKIIVAVPVAAPSTCEELSDEVDQIVCIETPEPFQGVGAWYEDFSQTTDEEVRELLELAQKNREVFA